MKLNLRPKNSKQTDSRIFAHVTSYLSIFTALHLITPVCCADLAPSPTESPSVNRAVVQPERDVTNLLLTSDFRAVKLRWKFEHNKTNVPVSFEIRYCELTSWNIEIKCRHRNLRVESVNKEPESNDSRHSAGSDFSVIGATIDSVRQLEPPSGQTYEAQVFDLRALTNYTFQVQVSRFAHELETDPEPAKRWQPEQHDRSQAARRLSLSNQKGNGLLGRVETKPFGAEATKCLADVSEVVVNTGRYFGGRISVEDSLDPRCNLLGNRSSEQTTYLFRIDHQICDSKIVDGNRIETMILVHENKDILTHNTARFLVLCNFQQKSFTLRASVSLPKVNGVVAPSRQAVITSLPGKPVFPAGQSSEQETSVMLGSMPGIYRVRANLSNEPEPFKAAKAGDKTRASDQLYELETNAIESSADKGARPTGQVRQSKKLAGQKRNSNASESPAPGWTSAGAMGDPFPKPVQVQSKVLFVERADAIQRSGRRHQSHRVGQEATATLGVVAPILRQVDTRELRATIQAGERHSQPGSKQSPASRRTEEESADLQAAPIIMTNNHRVAGDYLPISHSSSSSSSPKFPGDNNFSIKYSAAKVDDYPLERGEDLPVVELNGSQVRGRSGRMCAMEGEESQLGANLDRREQPSLAVNRMGEMVGEPGDLLAETTNESGKQVRANSTLAQNITSYLLKWSLKTLTNLARKSLESLAKGQNESEFRVQLNDSSSLLVGQENQFNGLGLKQNDSMGNEQSRKLIPAIVSLPRSGSESNRSTTDENLAALVTNIVTSKPLDLSDSGNRSGSYNNGSATASEEMRDGFVTGNKRADKATQSQIQNQTQAQTQTQIRTLSSQAVTLDQTAQPKQHSRPSNYSKSLDLGRSESLLKQRNLDRGRVSSSAKHRAPTNSSLDQDQSQVLRERLGNNRGAIRSDWLLYGLPLFAALLVGVFILFWLLLSPVRQNRRGQGCANLERANSPLTFNSSATPALVYGGNTCGHEEVLGSQPGCIRDVSYQRYDYNKFENFASETNNKSRLLVSPKLNQLPSRESPTASSQSTRSTSAGSTIMADENDCKNNEFLYTEHVLINSGSSFGESYA